MSRVNEIKAKMSELAIKIAKSPLTPKESEQARQDFMRLSLQYKEKGEKLTGIQVANLRCTSDGMSLIIDIETLAELNKELLVEVK